MTNLSKITVNHRFEHMSDLLEKDLLDAFYYHLENRLSAYLESALKHEDAQMHAELVVKKHSTEDLYDGSLICSFSGMDGFEYSADAFKDPRDLVSHATQHLKEWLSKEIQIKKENH